MASGERMASGGRRGGADGERGAVDASEAAAGSEAAGNSAGVSAVVNDRGGRVVQISRLRRRIAEKLLQAKQTAPHVWGAVDADYEALDAVRREQREAFAQRGCGSLTYLPFVASAVAEALAEFPSVNSSFDLENGTQTIHGEVNLGIAVDLDGEGLLVVTVREADRLSVPQLASKINSLAEMARGNRLAREDVTGSTFTITNPGAFGSSRSAPIINVPNVAILSTDAVRKRPVAAADASGRDVVQVRRVGSLGLSWDHRAFDGSVAMGFLNRVRRSIETRDWRKDFA